MSEFNLAGFNVQSFVVATLAEDLGEAGDITSAAVIPADARFRGVMDSRHAISVAGLPIAEAFFRALDPEVTVELLVDEGDRVGRGTDLMRVEGKARAIGRPATLIASRLSITPRKRASAGITAAEVMSPASPRSSASVATTKL